jgi:hypothetical protein
MRRLLTAAINSGLRHRTTKAGLMFYAHNGADTVTVHFTSSDNRAYKNVLAQFRKIGFDPLPKEKV